MTTTQSAGTRFRNAVAEESPLQVMGAITAYAGLMAKRVGYKALYLSGGGVAANSLGVPDLGISTMEDVLTDAGRIVDATGMPLLVDIDTGWGGAFNIARAVKSSSASMQTRCSERTRSGNSLLLSQVPRSARSQAMRRSATASTW